MNIELFIVTGTSGTGKSTLLPLLQESLSSLYKIYDWDEIVRPYDGTGDLWADEVAQELFRLTKINSKKELVTVALGLIRPEWIKKYQEEFEINRIKYCLLNITPEEREGRLRKRGAPEYLIHDLEELQGLPLWIKESGNQYETIDTSDVSVEVVSDQITGWINSNS
jgi:broad-specificity NMP kinase